MENEDSGKRAESVTRARDGNSGFLHNEDYILNNLVRRTFVTRFCVKTAR